MSTPIMTLVVGLVRGWVRVYTSGLPSEVRDARRAEIASDLWEQECDAGTVGGRPDETAWQVFGRWLLGIPADLSWRLEQVGAQRRAGKVSKVERRGNVNTLVAQRALLALVVLLTLMFIAYGALRVTDAVLSDSGLDLIIWYTLGTLGAIVLLAGLHISRRSPLIGSILVVGSAAAVGVIGWWTTIAPVLALLVAVFGVARARRFAREQSGGA